MTAMTDFRVLGCYKREVLVELTSVSLLIDRLFG